MKETCPCNPSVLYSDCCQIAHNNIKNIKTAEQLMRSRYAAFVLANGIYLLKSHHTSTKPTIKENSETVAWSKSVKWIKLEILNKTDGEINQESGTVEFKAYFYEYGKVNYIHENSVFLKENDVYKYKDRLN